jgi:lysophospholipase L1-like esterase
VQTVKLARGGYSVAMMKPLIDADLLALSDQMDAVIWNLGANDIGYGLPDEATWRADALYILDAMHVKWPNVLIYVMTPWYQQYPAGTVTLKGYIANLIPLRAFLRAGPDETIFIENGDNGATYSADGVHPNTAGYAVWAQLVQTALGY